MLKTIRFRVAVVFTVTFVSVSVLAAGLVYFQLKKNLLDAAYRQAEAQARAFAEQIETDPVFIPLPQENEAISVRLANDTTLVLFTSPQFHQFRNKLPSQFSRNPVVTVSRWIDTEHRLSVTFTRTDDELVVTLLNIRYLLGTSIGLSALLSVCIAYLLAGSLLRPIRKITETASQINLNRSLEPVAVPQTQDEVQQLAETFNEMLARISRTVEKQNYFFASASHELRTPLAIMQTEIEVKLRENDLPLDIKQLLANQLVESKRLQHLVEDFLLVSSLKNTELQLNLQHEPLDEILLEVLDRFTILLNPAGLKMNIELDSQADTFSVKGDRGKLTTVISNLTDNAIKYAIAGDTIQVKLFKNAENQLVLEIQNRISQKLINPEKLKNAFYQSDSLQNGYGMGLWIAKKILELHQATFVVEQHDLSFAVQVKFKRIEK